MEIWQLVSAAIAGLSLGVIAFALTRLPRSRVRGPVQLFVASGGIWIVGDLISTPAQDPGWKQAGLVLVYTGAIFLPALWWLVVMRWSKEAGAELPLRAAAWEWAPIGWAGLMWLAMLTNPWHGEFLTPVIGGRNVYEPLWYLMAVPNYGLVAVAVAVELEVARRVPRRSVRRQAAYLIAASAVTLIGNLLYVARVDPINLTIALLSISGALLVVGMAREGLFGVLPVALPAIAANHPDGLVVVGPDGHIRYLNERARELLAPIEVRADLDLLLTLQHPGLRPDADDTAKPLEASAWWLALTREEGVLFRKSGDAAQCLHLSAHRIERSRPNDGGYCLRIADVTAARQAERHVRQTRRLESVAALARTVSREFQNTLALVEGNALLLADQYAGDAPAARKLARIIESVRGAADLAHQLQLYAGTVDAERVPLELGQVVEEMCALVEPDLAPGHAMALVPGPRLLPVEADPIQIRHALYQVLVNAIDAMQETSGRIIVKTGIQRLDPARTDLVWGAEEPAGEFAFVSVRDQGGGMDPETAERAFEPYFSTRGKDRGTGLSTVLGVARAHDGLIALENVEGRGCTVTLFYPLAAA